MLTTSKTFRCTADQAPARKGGGIVPFDERACGRCCATAAALAIGTCERVGSRWILRSQARPAASPAFWSHAGRPKRLWCSDARGLCPRRPDATYVKVLEGGRLLRRAVMISLAVNKHAKPEALGVAIGHSEAATYCSFSALAGRSCPAWSKLVIADDHKGLRAAGCAASSKPPTKGAAFTGSEKLWPMPRLCNEDHPRRW